MADIEDNTRYTDLCRLCATKTTIVLAVNIFEPEGAMRQISKKIQNCLPIQVHEADELPKMICESCLYKLELLSDFRERTARTERILIDLFKELNASRLETEQPPILVDHNDLIMVQQHQLLNAHNLQNVTDLDLSHLNQREGMIVEHEIILTHHNVDINSHSLDSIDLNGHALTSQELSNQSLHTQESIMVETVNSQNMQDAHFEDDNLTLIQQHHLLNDQFHLQHGLHVGISDENKLGLSNSIKSELQPNYISDDLHKRSDNYLQHSDINNPQLNLPVQNSYTENVDDSNSCNSLLKDDNGDNKEMYILQNDKHDSITNLEPEVKAWFYCNICNKNFEQKSHFEKHYESHFAFRCAECMAVFPNPEVLDEHKKCHLPNSVPEKPVSPRLKNTTVPVKEKAEASKNESASEGSDEDCDNGQVEDPEEPGDTAVDDKDNVKKKKWTPKVCQACGKSYKTNYKLAEHMRKHTGEKPYKCTSCEKAFRSKIGLAQHAAKHTGQYSFACPTCGKGFQCKSYLMVHQRAHSDVKPFHCTTCGQNFKTKQSLLDHTNRHLGVKPYNCDICGRGFITKGLCRAHEKVHNGLDNRKYACKICSKMFVSKSYLQTHLRIHTGEKPFMCEVCGKAFLTGVDLKIHSTLHTGEKSYVCEICGKAFARRDALRCHRRSHTGERPYSCEICGQTFTQFTPMSIHKRLHTGERPFQCETCGKSFVSRSTMQAHAKKHIVKEEEEDG